MLDFPSDWGIHSSLSPVLLKIYLVLKFNKILKTEQHFAWNLLGKYRKLFFKKQLINGLQSHRSVLTLLAELPPCYPYALFSNGRHPFVRLCALLPRISFLVSPKLNLGSNGSTGIWEKRRDDVQIHIYGQLWAVG